MIPIAPTRRTIRWLLARAPSVRHIVIHAKVSIIGVVHNNFHTLAPCKDTIAKNRGGVSKLFFTLLMTLRYTSLLANEKRSFPQRQAFSQHYVFSPPSPPRLCFAQSAVPWRRKLPRKCAVTMCKGRVSI